MLTFKSRQHTPSRGEITLSQGVGLGLEGIGVKEILRPNDAVFIEDQSVRRTNVLEEEIRILVREGIAVFGATWIITFQDRLDCQAVCGAELELREESGL